MEISRSARSQFHVERFNYTVFNIREVSFLIEKQNKSKGFQEVE